MSSDGTHKACINCKPRNNCKYILNEYGYCCYYISSDDAWIFNLYIYKEFRRLGHAKEIIQMCVTAIRKNGYKKEIKIEAEPTEDSISIEDLVVFYRKMGLIVMNSTIQIEGTTKYV